jgi:hypothetical protein
MIRDFFYEMIDEHSNEWSFLLVGFTGKICDKFFKKYNQQNVHYLKPDKVYAHLEHWIKNCDFVIHAGGAGTTATALRAGIPQFIASTGCTTLSGNDKCSNTARIQELGVSPKFGIYKTYLEDIAELMNDIEQNHDMYNENSKKVQKNMQQEKGTENALTFIESMRKSYTVKFKIGDEVVYIGDNLRITGGFLTKSMVGKITSIHNENRDNSTYFVSFHGQKNTMTDNVYLARAVLKAKI